MEARGGNLKLVKAAVSMCAEHYPERNFMSVLVNVPGWFTVIYKIVELLMSKNQKERVRIFGASSKEVEKAKVFLHEHIDPKNLPECWGGTSVPFGESPEDQRLGALVDNVLHEQGVRRFVEGDPKEF